MFFLAWALNCPDEELPSASNVKCLMTRIKKFAEEVLAKFTETQIVMAVDYALTGCDPTTSEDYTPEQKEAYKEVYDIPAAVKSNAKQLLAEALLQGISGDVKWEVTVPQLERMIICAALNKGADVLKNEHVQNAAKFYACAGKIHERLTKKED